MTEIKLDDNYTVSADPNCWTLNYEKVHPERNAKGNFIVSRDASFHATLKQALAVYLDKCLEPSETILDVINRISEAEQRIEKAVGGVK